VNDCPDCYSSYSASTKCNGCEYRKWCKESTKIDKDSMSACFAYDDISYSESYAESPEQWKDKEGGQSPRKLLAELLYAIHDQPHRAASILQVLNQVCSIYRNNPACFSVTITKILHPEMSYEKIAERHNTSKQLVEYYLKRSIEQIPSLQSAILVDRRRIPHLKCPFPLTLSHNALRLNEKKRSFTNWIYDKFGTISEFSRRSEVKRTTILGIINGKKPRLQTRELLAEAMGITLYQLSTKYGI